MLIAHDSHERAPRSTSPMPRRVSDGHGQVMVVGMFSVLPVHSDWVGGVTGASVTDTQG